MRCDLVRNTPIRLVKHTFKHSCSLSVYKIIIYNSVIASYVFPKIAVYWFFVFLIKECTKFHFSLLSRLIPTLQSLNMSLQTQLTSNENSSKCNSYKTLKNQALKLEKYTAKKLLALNEYRCHISLIPSANEVALLRQITKIINQRRQIIKAMVRVKTYEEDVVQLEVTELRINQIQRLKDVFAQDILDFNFFKNFIANERKKFRVSFLKNSQNNVAASSIPGEKTRNKIEEDFLADQVDSFLSRNYSRADSPTPIILADNSPYLADSHHHQYYKSPMLSSKNFLAPYFSSHSSRSSMSSPLSSSSSSSSSSTTSTPDLEILATSSIESLNPFFQNHNKPQNYYIHTPLKEMSYTESIVSEDAGKKPVIYANLNNSHFTNNPIAMTFSRKFNSSMKQKTHSRIQEAEKQQLAFGICEYKPRWQNWHNRNTKHSSYKNMKEKKIGRLVFWQKPSTVFLIGFIFLFMAMLSIFAFLFLNTK